MSVEFKDYYDVLGVAAHASDAEIKNAFRGLARTYHPDVARDKAGAENRFKEINEANEVLSDPEKRRKYDELGANWNRPDRETPRRPGGFRGTAEGGPEFHFDGTGFSDFFEQFFGSRGRPPAGFGQEWETGRESQAAAQRGQDIEGDILVTLDEVLNGSTRTINLRRNDARAGQPTTQTLRVKIPPGVREAQLIRLAGKGQEGVGGGAAGDLFLRVKLAKHPDFGVRGCDLHFELVLAPWEAVLGATIHVPTLDGIVALRVPPGTTAEREFRLRGKGLSTGAGARGDLRARVSVQVPTQLTAEQKALWEQLAAQATFNPRKPS
jgi:curved DNA-binding protein